MFSKNVETNVYSEKKKKMMSAGLNLRFHDAVLPKYCNAFQVTLLQTTQISRQRKRNGDREMSTNTLKEHLIEEVELILSATKTNIHTDAKVS